MLRRDSLRAANKITLAVAGAWMLSVNCVLAEVKGGFEAPVRKDADNSRSVFVDIQPSEACNFGDLDLVLNELKNSDGALRLQLSVEELGVKDGAVAFGQPLEKKFDGPNMGTYDVRLPSSSGTKVYGVFLCTVSPEDLAKVPCSAKRLLSFEEMSRAYKVDLRPVLSGAGESAPYVAPAAVEAKLYFAQFLIDNGNSLWVLEDSASKGAPEVLKGLGLSQSQSESVMPVIEKFSGTLGSLPIRSAEQRLQMVLPFFSDKKCNG